MTPESYDSSEGQATGSAGASGAPQAHQEIASLSADRPPAAPKRPSCQLPPSGSSAAIHTKGGQVQDLKIGLPYM